MPANPNSLFAAATLLFALPSASFAEEPAKPDRKSQYTFGEITVPGAFAEEPIRETFSKEAALAYLERGATAWTKKRQCVSCHTNGSYLLTRPSLTKVAGAPSEDMRQFFAGELKEFQVEERAKLKEGLKPTQIAYIAAGLAQWDRHVAKKLSPETDAALALMFDAQAEDGSFSNVDCWPPLESSNYHGSTVAALATAAAPGWVEKVKSEKRELAKRYDKLTAYLRDTVPPHDYGQLLLLWVSARIPDLIDADRREAIVKSIWKRQQKDGGWSLRTFATPETWGGGNRAEKLRAEPEFENPPSDGHMTGLAVLVLREAGVPKSDPRIERAVTWIKSNQRESGRWWTRSLNTDKAHYITYSGTCYPLLALEHCDELR